ncbi:MAG: PilW family protein [Methylophilaceae bacterium]
MLAINQKQKNAGFGLVELLVGLVIGLLATLVIMQVFSAFEGQKRSTSGTNDAQTSGSVALHSLQRDVQLAGYGLPLYDANNLSLKCATTPTFDHDNDPATPGISMLPIEIIDGGALPGASDIITVRYGNSASGGIPVQVSGTITADTIPVFTNMACNSGDAVFAVTGTSCMVTTVVGSDADLTGDKTHIALKSAAGISNGSRISCLGAWGEFQYQVDIANSTLLRNGIPIVAGVVNLQAQYGISNAQNDNQIRQWVDATGAWAAPGNVSAACNAASANRNCIKAIRVAVVARNGLLERDVVSTACSSTTVATPTGVCAWDATSANPTVASPAPVVDLSNTPSWSNYRYRVYESLITLRNIVWTKDRL